MSKFKRQLSKADSKLRDLFVSGGRRGSGNASGSASSPVSPQDEQPSVPFGESSSECTPCLTPAETPTEELVKDPDAPIKDQPAFDEDGVPIRPPRRLKKCVSAGAATAGASNASAPQATSRAHPPKLKSSWKRKWQSNDETNSACPQILDLRPDESDAQHTGFLDNIVRKLRKKLDSVRRVVRYCRSPRVSRMFCPFRTGLPIRRWCEFS